MAANNYDFAKDVRFKSSPGSNYSAIVDPSTTWGVWEGWGTSLCWWAKAFGDRDDLADLFFTLNYTTIVDQASASALPGLGLNIVRYNAGGSSYALANGESMKVSPNIEGSRQVFGFWQDWESSDPSSGSWNWSASVDANQISMLVKAQERGSDLLELFSNSPMWWMCGNHNPSGADSGSSDNLEEWNQRNHTVYLANVAAHARDEWGVNFDFVEAFNEPVSDWWDSEGTQEGCHFDTSTQEIVAEYLREELDAKGLFDVIVAASDENTYDEARSTWNSFDESIQAQIGKVNVHGYQQGNGRRDLLYDDVGGARLWNSEYGDGDATGLSLAANLNLDFVWLHNTAWVYWQVLDGGGWGLLQSDENTVPIVVGETNMKFFVVAHYTRHIRPGSTILTVEGGSDSVVAYDPSSRKLVIVAVTYHGARWMVHDLSEFASVGGPVNRWVTAIDGSGDQYAEFSGDVAVSSSGQISVYFPSKTIMTFEIDNVII